MNEGAEAFGFPCLVLIVDDDPDCLEEYAEIVGSLGYECLTATNAPQALRTIAGDRRIGIVITDLRMPEMDGQFLLDELSERFLGLRPLVTVVVTGDATLDSAIKAMRSSAVDFLAKPVSLEGLSHSLRRAMARWVRLAAQHRLLASTRAEASGPEGESADKTPRSDLTPSREDLQRFASLIMKNRQVRSKYFDPEVLSGPAWDILIDLAAAGLKGEKVPTSSACASTHVPLSTALRHVNQLVDAGLVRRELDTTDRRRTLLELEPHALDLMTRYLASSWEALDARD